MPRKNTLNPATARRRRQAATQRQPANQRAQERVTRRETRRNHRLQLYDANRPHLPQPQLLPQIYFDQLKQDVDARRRNEKLPKTYCTARILHHDHEVQRHNAGALSEVCVYCSAKLYPGEMSDNSASICCHKGKVSLEHIPVPEELKQLIEHNDDDTKNYLENIRKFNNALAFASVQVQSLNIPGRGPFCFKVHGQVYHTVGSLLPPEGVTPAYAGLFILDYDTALQHRITHAANRACFNYLMDSLQTMLCHHNPYAQLFNSLKDVSHNAPQMQLQFTTDNTFHSGRVNAPTVSEVAAVFVSNDGAPPGSFDFVIHSKTGSFTNISYLNPHSDPMCYPLLFPCGDAGWKPGMQHVNVHATAVRTVTTQLQYYCYRLAIRGDFNIIQSAGKLFQQYVVDSYVKVEGSRIAYVRAHQKELRADSYKGIMDFLNTNAQQRGAVSGIPVILPSTFIGSPRNMLQNYQDAMSVVARFGKPDIFLTFTCNPKWIEISSELKAYERTENRPDLITRVFHLKLKSLLDDLTKKHVLGVIIAYVCVVEFQKRGLPHAHILLILREEEKLRSIEDIDSLISAEIPNKDEDPQLYETVKLCMVHGPCGTLNPNSPCMQDGQCTKDYPKLFRDETNIHINGYPQYRRRDDRVTLTYGQNDVDNRWIVPYNRFLTAKYQAHINVEHCASIQSVKYLYKYVYKGHDCASLPLRNDAEGQQRVTLDEVDIYLNCRYVSPPEAMWRLHERQLFQRSHTVERLPVHLPDEHLVYFQTGQEDRVNLNRDSKLMAFLKLNAESETARHYLYHEIPEHYVWANGHWKSRKKNVRCIGRIYTVNPTDTERYYLRILLFHVRGPTSFEDLRTVDGTICHSFHAAAVKLHLVDDEAEWKECLQEAAGHQMPTQLRWLFAIICLFCSPTNVCDLWETFKQALSEDFHRQYPAPESANLALHEIAHILKQHGKKLRNFDLPESVAVTQIIVDSYCVDEQRRHGQESYSKLNREQKAITDEVLLSVRNKIQTVFSLTAQEGPVKHLSTPQSVTY